MSKLAVLRPEAASPSFTWAIPGAPVQVTLALSVVSGLQRQFDTPGGKAAEQGLLWGADLGGITEIQAFTPVAGSQPPSISDVESAIPPSGVSVPVGYYRLHHEAELRLNDDDIALAQAVFPAPYQVLLLIQPREFGPAVATFFFWEEGRMFGDFPFLEFKFDHSLLATAENQRMQARNKELPAESPLPAAPLLAAQIPVPERRRKRSLRTVFLSSLAAVVVLAPLVMAVTGRFSPKSPARAPSSPALLHPAPATVSGPGALGFQAERQNRDLKLTWNRESAAIRNATSGELSIQDTSGSRQIRLDPANIRTGTIFYSPTADQIQLQLTIVSPQGTASESILAILPKRGAPRVQTVVRSQDPPAAIVPGSHASQRSPKHRTNAASIISVARAPHADPQSSVAQDPAPPAIATPVFDLRSDPVGVVLAETKQNAAPPPPRVTPEAVRSSPERLPAQAATPVYSPAVMASSVPAAYPPALKGMDLPAKVVQIKVSIDENGRVVRAGLAPNQSGLPLPMIAEALEAARQWRFTPAKRDTQPIPSETILRFEFDRRK